MNIRDVIQYVELDAFYEAYKPLSPYGKRAKNNYAFYTDAKELNRTYKSIGLLIGFIEAKSFIADKIENYLKKISLLNTLHRKRYDSTSIFLIKKLLFNYSEIVKLLSDGIRLELNIDFASQSLLDLLSLGQRKSESFYLSEAYSKRLSELREEIFELDKSMAQLKLDHLDKIAIEENLDFRVRDFIIIPDEKSRDFNTNLIYKEVYDQYSILVKPIFPDSFFKLNQKREALLDQENAEEEIVLTAISKRIIAERKLIESYVENITELDTLFAKARLAIQYEMTAPKLNEKHENIAILKGEFLPLKAQCIKTEKTYTPLNVQFDNKTIVVTGANMGGKTELLKTLGFMQVLAQMGFWVPAKSFKTSIFDNIHFIGQHSSKGIGGLSSFGLEIFNLTEATKDKHSNTLLLIDEFARTTNSIEARALLIAILSSFASKDSLSCFISTHFMELPPINGLSYYKMKGLDYDAFAKYYKKDKQYSLEERIALINSFMCFEIEKKGIEETSLDAVRIAEILGLDEEIIAFTKEQLEGNYV